VSTFYTKRPTLVPLWVSCGYRRSRNYSRSVRWVAVVRIDVAIGGNAFRTQSIRSTAFVHHHEPRLLLFVGELRYDTWIARVPVSPRTFMSSDGNFTLPRRGNDRLFLDVLYARFYGQRFTHYVFSASLYSPQTGKRVRRRSSDNVPADRLFLPYKKNAIIYLTEPLR